MACCQHSIDILTANAHLVTHLPGQLLHFSCKYIYNSPAYIFTTGSKFTAPWLEVVVVAGEHDDPFFFQPSPLLRRQWEDEALHSMWNLVCHLHTALINIEQLQWVL